MNRDFPLCLQQFCCHNSTHALGSPQQLMHYNLWCHHYNWWYNIHNLHRFGGKFSTSNLFYRITYGNMMEQLLNNNHKICCCQKIISLKWFWLQSCKMDRPRRCLCLDGLYGYDSLLWQIMTDEHQTKNYQQSVK